MAILRLTEEDVNSIIINAVKRYILENRIITESQESKSISAAKKLVMQKLGYDEQNADEFVRVKIRNDVPVLRTPQGGKFILGVTRMFLDGEISTANEIGNLNATLKIVASDAHINEYDRNLNSLSYQDLSQRFAKAMSDNLDREKDEVGQMEFNTSSDYEIVRIDSFEEASEYGKYVSWCVTHDESMFDSYTSNGINQFYFCLRNGFREEQNVIGDGCPLDSYGLSMIAVSVTENGMLNTCTCRWNHDNGGNDNIMNTKQLSKILSLNFFDVFKPNSKMKDMIASAKELLLQGEELEDVFDDCRDFNEGFAAVEIGDKWNFIDSKYNFLSDSWFNECGDFHGGFACIVLNDRYNYINKEGGFLSEQWFDDGMKFSDGFAAVQLNRKWNFIDRKGGFLSEQWFDYCWNFKFGYAKINILDKYNFIDTKNNLVSEQWLDFCLDFVNGFSFVELHRKYNFMNQNGDFMFKEWLYKCERVNEDYWQIENDSVIQNNHKVNWLSERSHKLLSKIWLDYIEDCHFGIWRVKLDDKWNFMDENGEFLSEQWFEYCGKFNDGFGLVELNGKNNFIDRNGNFLSKQWFDDGKDFEYGMAYVKINDQWKRIDKKGRIFSV